MNAFKSHWKNIIASKGITLSYTPTEFVSDIVKYVEAISKQVKYVRINGGNDEKIDSEINKVAERIENSQLFSLELAEEIQLCAKFLGIMYLVEVGSD